MRNWGNNVRLLVFDVDEFYVEKKSTEKFENKCIISLLRYDTFAQNNVTLDKPNDLAALANDKEMSFSNISIIDDSVSENGKWIIRKKPVAPKLIVNPDYLTKNWIHWGSGKGCRQTRLDPSYGYIIHLWNMLLKRPAKDKS